ncbi:MAG: hypothetical protein ACXIUM_15745 [Wenzhouxiangella sp.]
MQAQTPAHEISNQSQPLGADNADANDLGLSVALSHKGVAALEHGLRHYAAGAGTEIQTP